MPIRINLLAENQAAEDIRRRDPVKRAICAGICITVVVLVWSSSLQVKIMADKSRLNNLEASLGSRTNQYVQILDNQKKLVNVSAKLAALNRLAASRFLQATLLDALQHSTLEGIQINHFRTEQTLELVPEVKAVTEEGRKIPGKPAMTTEKIRLILDARDTSPNPGSEQINKFKDVLAHTPYFETERISTNNILLKNLSQPQLDNESGRPYVLFSLECLYPERSH
jgi:hypothetical protein